MKYVLLILRLLLPVAAIVLAALSMKQTGDARTAWLGAGVVCLNGYCLYRDRKAREKEQS